MALVEFKASPPTLRTSVFQPGDLSVKSITVGDSAVSSSRNPIYIVTPTDGGTYPVLQFLHGFMLSSTSYSRLLYHIASHGFIIIAPQLYSSVFTSNTTEIQRAAAVINWLATGLQSLLPGNVTCDLTKLGLAGHSRGGKTAFSLALGQAETTLKYSALLGIDPVAGMNTVFQTTPKILTFIPRSFRLGIPVGIIGTGLGNQQKSLLTPPCAPDGVNHAEFWNESQPPCSYFLAKDFGHMDMLDDTGAAAGRCICKGGGLNSLDSMRKGTAGIVVAFMKAYLKGQDADLLAIVHDPMIAPINLDPVLYVPA